MKTVQYSEKRAHAINAPWGKLEINSEGQAQVTQEQLDILLTVPGFSEVSFTPPNTQKPEVKTEKKVETKTSHTSKRPAKVAHDLNALPDGTPPTV